MKIIYLILVSVIFSCTSSTEKETPAIYNSDSTVSSKERTVVVGPYIELKPNGNSMVITTYSDSSMTIVNLNKDGELLDSNTIYTNQK